MFVNGRQSCLVIETVFSAREGRGHPHGFALIGHMPASPSRSCINSRPVSSSTLDFASLPSPASFARGYHGGNSSPFPRNLAVFSIPFTLQRRAQVLRRYVAQPSIQPPTAPYHLLNLQSNPRYESDSTSTSTSTPDAGFRLPHKQSRSTAGYLLHDTLPRTVSRVLIYLPATVLLLEATPCLPGGSLAQIVRTCPS